MPVHLLDHAGSPSSSRHLWPSKYIVRSGEILLFEARCMQILSMETAILGIGIQTDGDGYRISRGAVNHTLHSDNHHHQHYYHHHQWQQHWQTETPKHKQEAMASKSKMGGRVGIGPVRILQNSTLTEAAALIDATPVPATSGSSLHLACLVQCLPASQCQGQAGQIAA